MISDTFFTTAFCHPAEEPKASWFPHIVIQAEMLVAVPAGGPRDFSYIKSCLPTNLRYFVRPYWYMWAAGPRELVLAHRYFFWKSLVRIINLFECISETRKSPREDGASEFSESGV